ITTVTSVDGTAQGAALVAVTPGGPADRAGLRAGDVIRKLGPAPTPDADALLSALAAADPGQRVELTIMREGEMRPVPVTLGTRPAPCPMAARERHAAGSVQAASSPARGRVWRALLEAQWRARLQEVTELSLAYHEAAAVTAGPASPQSERKVPQVRP